jgi:hypothetical protein
VIGRASWRRFDAGLFLEITESRRFEKSVYSTAATRGKGALEAPLFLMRVDYMLKSGAGKRRASYVCIVIL